MKLSDLKSSLEPREEWTLPYPRSSLADPPISAEEARTATHTNCIWHKGLIAGSPNQDDTEGRVYFCPIGRMYWRYTRKPKHAKLLRPLKYGWRASPV